jgi:hypothetical protein
MRQFIHFVEYEQPLVFDLLRAGEFSYAYHTYFLCYRKLFLLFLYFSYNPDIRTQPVFLYILRNKRMASQLNARHKPVYSLLTFYKFVDIPESELDSLAQEHLDFTRDIGLR